MSTWHPVRRFPRWLSWLPDGLYGPLRWALRLLLGLALLLLTLVFYYGLRAMRFDMGQVTASPAATQILDVDDQPLDPEPGEDRGPTSSRELPPFLVQALLAREDARFERHHGVDFLGLGRATLRNLRDLDFTQGGSTLTMQLARNTFDLYSPALAFSDKLYELDRKATEIAVALRLETHFTKDAILTHYLNQVYFGAGCHGIRAAARTYFGKPVASLHPGEAAMLVGVIRGPHIFCPSRHPEAARAQQREVLDRMIDVGHITPAEKSRILQLPITIDPDADPGRHRSYARLAIRQELTELLDVWNLRGDGLIVRTTLAPAWQLQLETTLTTALKRLEQSRDYPHPTHADHDPGEPPAYLQCSAVTLDSASGHALAWIGGRDFLDSRFDRARGARRDLGEALEPWIAAAAAERGKRILPGRPVVTGRQLGPREVARLATRCGLGGPFLDTEDLFRGSGAASPLETATALATLATRGQRPQPHLIRSIHAADGTPLYQRQSRPTAALRGHAAEQALDLFDSRGPSRCFYGTTGSRCDAWLLRVGPQGSTAIWIGFDQPTPIAPAAQLDPWLDQLAQALSQ